MQAKSSGPHQQNALRILDVLLHQTDRRLIEAGLPSAVLVGNKTGEVSGTLNDVTIVDPFGANPIAVSLLMTGIYDYGLAVRTFNKIGFVIFASIYDNLVRSNYE
jgi:beta-lactamase class A